jgi:hypothetical protein
VDAGLVVAAEDEERKRSRIAPDRRLGRLGPGVERESGVGLGAAWIAAQQPVLDHRDGPAPAARRRVGEALAVTLGRAGEPLAGLVGAAEHEQRQAGAARRVPHPRQLPLTRIGVGRLREPLLAVAVPVALPLVVRSPIL